MKWIALCLGGLMLAIVAVSSCSINHRSGQYECTVTADCDPGRTCSGGLCVGTVDAPGKRDGGVPDANLCPSQCTSCAGNTCTIDCAAGAICQNAVVTCPPGWNCAVRCNTQNSCRSGVMCQGTLSCDVQCSGQSSCRAVNCGATKCTVGCTGQRSCESVNCNNSCACDVTCSLGINACANVVCNKLVCDTGLGCTSTNFSCNTCP